MSKKTRLIILLACVVCFFVIAPVLVFYSMGYRFDFEKLKITAIGGIYVNTNPKAERIIIDDKIVKKPGILSNEVSFLNLLPRDHSVLVEKSGYYDYSKIIPVKEKEVTKLENIILFKKNTQFELVTSAIQSPFSQLEKFIIKNNNLYYSNSLENSTITATQKLTPILKNLVAYSLSNGNIIWLSTDGLLYQSDISDLPAQAGKNQVKLTLQPIKIVKTNSYKIITYGRNTLINANGNLLLLNSKTNNLDVFSSFSKNANISPDGKNIAYHDDKYIYISLTSTLVGENNIIYSASDKIDDLLWVNNNYLIFTTGNKIIISEIDYRGNINKITLPQKITLTSGKEVEITKPKIFLNQQTGKLYIQTGETLLVTEKILP